MRIFVSTVILAVAGATVMFAGDAAAGKAIYDTKCKMCHGADGSGKAMKLKDIKADSDADLKKSVTEGWGKMKPVSSVKPDQVDDLIAYIRSMK
jgi:cytochrome c6